MYSPIRLLILSASRFSRFISQFIILCDKRLTGPCVKYILYNLVILFQYSHWYSVCLLAGMAELHPEECRTCLYRVGQWRQVGNSDLLSAILSPRSSTSSLSFQPYPIGHFPISPSLDHITAPQAPTVPEVLVMDLHHQSLIGGVEG